MLPSVVAMGFDGSCSATKKNHRRNIIKTHHLFDRHVVLVIPPLPDGPNNRSNNVIIMLTLALKAERDESTLTLPSLDVPRDALEPSHCSSSSNSTGTLPDTLLSFLGASNRDATLCWISHLIQNLH